MIEIKFKPGELEKAKKPCPQCGVRRLWCFNVWQEAECECGALLYIDMFKGPRLRDG